MSIERQSQRRRRRAPEETREAALAAAQALLVEQGPEAVTLQAVARAIGMTHANLIHHFGSASGLQAALMARIVDGLKEGLRARTAEWLGGGGAPAGLVEPVFEAFREGGGAQLAARMATDPNAAQVEPVAAALRELTQALISTAPDRPDLERRVARSVMLATYMAFADAIIGPRLKGMLGLAPDEAEEMTAELIEALAADRDPVRSR